MTVCRPSVIFLKKEEEERLRSHRVIGGFIRFRKQDPDKLAEALSGSLVGWNEVQDDGSGRSRVVL